MQTKLVVVEVLEVGFFRSEGLGRFGLRVLAAQLFETRVRGAVLVGHSQHRVHVLRRRRHHGGEYLRCAREVFQLECQRGVEHHDFDGEESILRLRFQARVDLRRGVAALVQRAQDFHRHCRLFERQGPRRAPPTRTR
jgi:hypothetical protein